MVELVFVTPFVTGLLALVLPRSLGRQLLVFTGAVHLVLSLLLWKNSPRAFFAEYFAVTPEGMLSLLVTGMFLLMARRNAIAMVIGYIMLENGIYLTGTTFSTQARHIVEFGILLDVLAGVMIMAIILQNIKRTFDDVDTSLLRTLKE
jgi:hydrogenase-4 component E